jgi:lysophospholipid acyltransferase (LPLAT)-like uncharacterized protein
LLQIYSRTLRLSVENEKKWLDYMDSGGRVLLCTWHQQFFVMIRHFPRYRPYQPVLMTSQSRDGDMIAALAKSGGWHAIRGSSSKGGRQALSAVIRALRQSRPAVVIVDGPRGPAGRVKPGVIQMASASRAAILPFYTSAESAWYLNSWDRFMIPKPFTHVRIRFGDLLFPEGARNRKEIDRYCEKLQQIMDRHLIIP